MTYQRLLELARSGRLKPTDISGLRWSLKPEDTAKLCVEPVDGRLTNLSRYCAPVAHLRDHLELARIARRFDPVDDV